MRPGKHTVYEIDGRRFSTLEGFFTEVSLYIIPGFSWGHNLNAFNDILRGGFGTPAGGFTIRWLHHRRSMECLGYSGTIRYVESALEDCDPQDLSRLMKYIADVRAGREGTIFEWLVEIISRHGPGGEEESDGVLLELA